MHVDLTRSPSGYLEKSDDLRDDARVSMTAFTLDHVLIAIELDSISRRLKLTVNDAVDVEAVDVDDDVLKAASMRAIACHLAL